MLTRRELLFAAVAEPCVDLKFRARIAPEREPGRPLVVSGRVLQSDGHTPAAGVTMYVYHTDATGEYGGTRESGPRLRGWLSTDAQGRYEYATIRPEPYPSRNIPAHVHVHFWGNGVPPQWTDDLLFDDDPLVSAADRERSRALGPFAFVQKGELRGGVLHVTRNYRLKPHGDRFAPEVRHGLRACGVQAG